MYQLKNNLRKRLIFIRALSFLQVVSMRLLRRKEAREASRKLDNHYRLLSTYRLAISHRSARLSLSRLCQHFVIDWSKIQSCKGQARQSVGQAARSSKSNFPVKRRPLVRVHDVLITVRERLKMSIYIAFAESVRVNARALHSRCV